jgi:uncharacterized integral membrane protein (TIGR00698 family)
MQEPGTPTVKDSPSLHEDWIAVIFGFLIIFVSLAGVLIPVPVFSWSDPADLVHVVLAPANLSKIGAQLCLTLAITGACSLLLGKAFKNTIITFLLVYVLTVIAVVLSGHKEMKALNLESVIFSLFIGLLVGNLFKLPRWLLSALSTELFVKIGLVLLGTTIIFGEILTAGALGLIQAVVVVLSVWYFAYWICKRFKIDDEMTMMISSAVSICGVSAAIAIAGAIKGDTKKLSYVISLVLILAIPMMIFMPYIARALGLPEAVTGAWLGGTIDTTGAVVASGTLVGETALKISTIVKFSQNVLLGLAAFAISVYWTYTKKGPENSTSKPGLSVLWERFPKFVLGFIAASLIFSFFIDPGIAGTVKSSLKNIQTLWFVLAFTSIGLETKFSEIVNSDSKRPFLAFVIAQLFNIIITLVVAYLLFR